MAKVIVNKAKKTAARELPFGKQNLYLLAVGLGMLIIGYIMMAQPPVDSFWSLSASPVVLMVAYLIVIPFAIMYGRKKKNNDGQQ